jgi:ABC-type Fe3+-hydroxamate transport system substrate-binding protein
MPAESITQLKVIDQIGREVVFNFPPKRIVSVVPSQTELLFNLGLHEEITAVTWFCIHPEDAQSKTKIGGTKNLKLDKIRKLQPDLIIANKEENEKEQIEALAKDFPVWTSDIHNLDQALDMCLQLGYITGKNAEAKSIADRIRQSFRDLPNANGLRVLYLIWKGPYMSVGRDTFISYMLDRCGFVNVMQDTCRYPEVSEDAIKELKPDLIFLSSEPYPFKEKHIAELQQISPESKVILVDGEMFSWYGSRLLYAADYLKELINPLL